MSGRLMSALGFVAAVGGLAGWRYAPFGFSGLDEGFLTALAWRVVSGEIPYRDFIYIRPPGSVLLHALPLLLVPDPYVVIAERYLLFLVVAAYSWIAAAVLDHGFELPAMGVPRWALALAGFALSLQGFPPMPWHTVDGLLFSALGIWALTCMPGAVGVGAGMVGLALAASCKQSFVFLLPLALAHVALVRGARAFWVGAAVIAATGATAAGVAVRLGMLVPALEQIGGSASPVSLLYAGVVAYVKGPASLAAGLVVCGLVAAAAWRAVARARIPGPVLAYGALAAVIGLQIASVLRARSFQQPVLNFPGLLLVASAASLLLWPAGRSRAARLDAALLLAAAWCASLSWGYPTPLLFATPLVFGVVWGAWRALGAAPRALTWTVAALALAAQAAAYAYPYREEPRARLDRDLGAVYARLAGVHSGPRQFDKLTELRDLQDTYGEGLVVLPGMPLLSYLDGELPRLPVDWARNAEVGPAQQRVIAALERERPAVLIERDPHPPCHQGAACCATCGWVERHWRRVRTTRFFDVYLPPSGLVRRF